MPTYEFVCKHCNYEFEEILKLADREVPTISPCPKCNNTRVTQKMSCSAINMNGRDSKRRPRSDFIERMKQVKKGLKYDKKAKIKDY